MLNIFRTPFKECNWDRFLLWQFHFWKYFFNQKLNYSPPIKNHPNLTYLSRVIISISLQNFKIRYFKTLYLKVNPCLFKSYFDLVIITVSLGNNLVDWDQQGSSFHAIYHMLWNSTGYAPFESPFKKKREKERERECRKFCPLKNISAEISCSKKAYELTWQSGS